MKRSHKERLLTITKWIIWGFLIYVIIVLWKRKYDEDVEMKEEHVEENVSQISLTTEAIVKMETEQWRRLSTKDYTDEVRVSCPQISAPFPKTVDGHWQAVDKSEAMFVVSAYFIKERSSVFVVGVRTGPENEINAKCQLWSGDDDTVQGLIEETDVKRPQHWDYNGYEYTSIVYECHVHTTDKDPVYVSMVTHSCESPNNVLRINNASKVVPYKRRLTICMKPLTSQFYNALYLSKWIEINKIFGVDKFVVYNYTSRPNIAKLLDYYIKEGVVDVVQWMPPFVVNGLHPETRPVQLENYGEVAALNDCLFRTRWGSKFISHVAVNEYIIPRGDRQTTIDVINDIDNEADAYYICMAFLQKVLLPNGTRNSTGTEVIAQPERQNTKTVVHTGHMGARLSRPVIRTSRVNYTLTRSVPGVDSVIVGPHMSVLHVHPGVGQSQLLGTVIDEALPISIVNKVNSNVENIRQKIGNI